MRSIAFLIVSLMLCSFGCETQQKAASTSTSAPATAQTRSLPEQTFVPYHLKGNEPFWNIKVEEDKITLRQLGETAIVYPYQAPVKKGQMLYFETSTQVEGQKSILKISMEEKTCTDNMSGERSAYTVSVDKDGKQLQGCGNKS